MWYFILFFSTLIVDQLSKILVDYNKTSVTLIDGVLRISISYNEGASFSFLSGKDWAQTFFIILTAVVLIAGFAYLIVKKPKTKWLCSSVSLLFSGTIGNFIDRLAFGHVRDFIDVPFFANFNIADSCLCIGAFMLVLYVLFFDEDALFKTDKNRKNKDEAHSTDK